MGVKLTDDEVKDFLEKGHTLIIATTRKSGEPFMTPIWYVYIDGSFYVNTLAKSAKVEHIRRDPRVCCLVEEGEKWVDLKAVVVNCDAAIVEDEANCDRVRAALNSKYAAFRVDRTKAPAATQAHYATAWTILQFKPRAGEIRSWYNRKIKMAS